MWGLVYWDGGLGIGKCEELFFELGIAVNMKEFIMWYVVDW